MSDFDTYLQQLRASLDVSPARAEVILAETLSHLEAKAAALQQAGLNREYAVRLAIAEFGEPTRLAHAFTPANDKPNYHFLRVLVSIFVMIGAFIGTFGFIGLPLPNHSLTGSLASHLPVGENASMLLLIPAMIPAALACGAIAGRWFWWIPSIFPAFIMSAFGFVQMVGQIGYYPSDPPSGVVIAPRDPSLAAINSIIVWPGVMLAVFEILAYIGGRLINRKYTRGVILSAMVLYLAFWLMSFLTIFLSMLAHSSFSDATALLIIAVFIECVFTCLLIVLHREGVISHQRLLKLGIIGLITFILFVSFTAWMAILLATTNRFTPPDTATWFPLTVGTIFAIGLVLGYYRYRETRATTDVPVDTPPPATE